MGVQGTATFGQGSRPLSFQPIGTSNDLHLFDSSLPASSPDFATSAAVNIGTGALAGSAIPVIGTAIGAGLGLISTILQYNAAKNQIKANERAQKQNLALYEKETAKADKRYAEETAYSHKMDKRNMKLQDENIRYQKALQFSANLKDFFNRKPEALSRLMQIQQFEGA